MGFTEKDVVIEDDDEDSDHYHDAKTMALKKTEKLLPEGNDSDEDSIVDL